MTQPNSYYVIRFNHLSRSPGEIQNALSEWSQVCKLVESGKLLRATLTHYNVIPWDENLYLSICDPQTGEPDPVKYQIHKRTYITVKTLVAKAEHIQ